jgi:hypothetical protein
MPTETQRPVRLRARRGNANLARAASPLVTYNPTGGWDPPSLYRSRLDRKREHMNLN